MATITDMYGQNWALSEGGRQQYAFDLNKWQTDTAGMENPPPPPDPNDIKYYTQQYLAQQPTMNNQIIGSSWVNKFGQAPTALDPTMYDLQLMPAATNGADNKYEAADSWLNAGAYYDPARDYWNRLYYIPKEGTPGYVPSAKITNLVDLNPDIPKDNFLDTYLPLLALGVIGGGALGMFGGAGAIGGEAAALGGAAEGVAAGSTLADLYGAATGTSVAAAPAAATGSTLYGAATGALPALGGIPMDWTDSFSSLYDYSPAEFYGPTASGIPLDAAMNMAGPTQSGWTLDYALGNEATAGALSGASGNGILGQLTDYVTKNPSQTLQSAAKLFGLTNEDGSLNLKTLGSLGAAGLGAYASNQQSKALEDTAKRYEEYGAPYRKKLSDLYANPSSFLSSPEVRTSVDQGTNSLMRSLSVQGNPFGSGNALQQGQSYASDQLFGRLGQEKDRLAGFGGLSSYNQAAPQANNNAIGSSTNMWNALGAGANNIFNPPETTAQTIANFSKMMGR